MPKKPMEPPVNDPMYRGTALSRTWHRYFIRVFDYMKKTDIVEIQDVSAIFDSKGLVTHEQIDELKEYIATALADSPSELKTIMDVAGAKSNRAYLFSLTAA